MEIFNRLVILQLMFTLYFQLGSIKSLYIEKKISPDDFHSQKFSHLAIYRDQGTLFISAGNRLYKLSSDLELLANVSTSWGSHITNMFINDKNSEFIVCESIHGFWCSFYGLEGNMRQLKYTKRGWFSHESRNCTNSQILSFYRNCNQSQKGDINSQIYIAMSYCNYSSNDSALFAKTVSKNAQLDVSFDNRAMIPERHVNYRNEYKVNYVYGFSLGNYNYILTTQQEFNAAGSPYISKLIRIGYNADDDKLFDSYIEIPLECKFNNDQAYYLVQAASIGKPSHNLAKSMNIQPDDDVLFAVFSKSHDNHSALCIYSLKVINEKFAENVQNCHNGIGFLNFDTNEQCPNFGSSELNMPLVGNIPVSGSPSITFDSLLTAITVIRRDYLNDIYIGTKTGKLMRIVVNHISQGCKSNEFSIDEESSINSDLIFSPNNDYLYVMTGISLSKIKILQNSNCSAYNDFNSCLQTSAAKCGWCESMNRCTARCDCINNNSATWHSYDFREDVKIVRKRSLEFQIGAVGNIQLNITTIPLTHDDNFSCNFTFSNNNMFLTKGSLNRPENLSTQGSLKQISNYCLVFCEIPEIIPSIPKNEHYLNATLSISTLHIPNIVRMNITFFDCKIYNTCKACQSSGFSCVWCPKEKTCTLEAIKNCSKSNPAEFKSNMTIASGKHVSIKFPNVKSYDFCETTSNLKCLITIEGKNDTKNIMKKSDDVYCENTTYTYAKNTSNVNATVAIMWENSTFTDILSKTIVMMYKCQLMARNCTSCLTLDSQFKCGWCQNSNMCEPQGGCNDRLLYHHDKCPQKEDKTMRRKSHKLQIDGRSHTLQMDNRSNEFQIDGRAHKLQMDSRSNKFQTDGRSHELQMDSRSNGIQINGRSHEFQIDSRSYELQMDNRSNEFQTDGKSHKLQMDSRSNRFHIAGRSHEFQIDTTDDIQLKIKPLPQIGNQLSCSFVFPNSKNSSTKGSLNQKSSLYHIILCKRPKEIPPLPRDGHYLNATLSVSLIHIPAIVNVNITFFDCKTYNSCKACFSSRFFCSWCPKENKCTFEGLNSCSKNNLTKLNSNMIITSGKHASIEFPTMKLYDVCETTSNLKCLIIMEEKKHTKNIVMKNNNMYCENMTFTYTKNTSTLDARVAILWKTSTFTDILSETSVVIYKCQHMAYNCPSCLTINTEYNCGWCRSSNTCEFKDNCDDIDDIMMGNINTCLDPPPSILSFSPGKGPLEGGTNVTIKGEKLGFTFQDIDQDIEVAGVTCKPFKDEYIATKSITCGIEKSNELSSHEGPIVVYVNKKPITSEQNFKFVDPKIFEISPKNEPIYGAAELSIRGEHLDAGKLIQVFINNISCPIFSLTSQEIKCASNSSIEKQVKVIVEFDQNIRLFTDHKYKYENDPEHNERDENYFHGDFSSHIIPEAPKSNYLIKYENDPEQNEQVENYLHEDVSLHIIPEAPKNNYSIKYENDPEHNEQVENYFRGDVSSQVIPEALKNNYSICVIIASVFVIFIMYLLFWLIFQRKTLENPSKQNQNSQHRVDEIVMEEITTKQ